MYELRPESIRTFITDPSIELPRFQRKSTWTSKQNFNLAISVFRGFPLGVFVIKKDVVAGKAKRYLLDGRQRRNALKLMQDPEEVYRWARAAMKFRAGAEADHIADAYSAYLQTFLGEEEWERQASDPVALATELETELGATGDFVLADYAVAPVEAPELVDELPDEGVDGADPGPGYAVGDMQALLRTILVVHPIRGRTTAVTRLFDFRKYVEGLPYVRVDPADGKGYVVGRQILTWLDFKRRSHEVSDFPLTPDQLADWILEDARILPTRSETSFRSEVGLRWDRIAPVFQVVHKLEDLSQEGVIGYLEVRNSSPNDERKIFEIINTAGTPLTAVEILSARPSWNELVDEPNKALRDDVLRLYERMDLPFDGNVARWDVPATLMDRVEAPLVFGRLAADEPRAFERKLTLGFKLLSGHFAHSITKDDIATLAGKTSLGIPWGTSEFDQVLARVVKGLMEIAVFRFWGSWNLSLLGATSDAVALNFILLALADWQRKGEPTTAGSASQRKFARNAVVLLDRSIFEYVSGDWRGSSDSKIAFNLANLSKWDIAEPVASDRWKQLMDSVVGEGRINDQPYTGRLDPRIVTLLYYRSVVLGRLGPGNPTVGIHVDHIIPRTQFETESDASIAGNMHHIANLALLPQKENQQKSGRQLAEVTDQFLMARIAELEDILVADFPMFGTSSDSVALRAQRGALIHADLTLGRQTAIGKYT